LEAAVRWAEQRGAAEVEPRHLLLALLDEAEGRPALLLQGQGLAVEAVRAQLGGTPTAPPAEAGTPRRDVEESTRRWVYAARRLAADLAGESTVASEHLLLAVLAEDAPTRAALEPIGLDLQRLLADVRAHQAGPLPLDEPLRLPESAEQIDAARILDANANRAREALRVIEEYCRFVLDDRFLSHELKQLRHDLAEALAAVPAHHLLAARETIRDVGTGLSTPAEEQRHSPLAVAQANLKRMQEALRCLEEYGKLYSADVGRRVEALRYRAYTLERAIVFGTAARQRLAEARLYVLVTGSLCSASLEWTVREALAGGAQVIQLREKDLTDRELLDRARAVRQWTRAAGALFIVNDRPDIARLAEADGVHIGQDELTVKDVRRIVGPDALVGVSTHTLEQVRQAVRDGASYIGVGPVFPSQTKDFPALAGLAFVREAAAETSLPAFAIGGVNLENVHQVVAAGLRRVAVSHAICAADDPRAVAAALRQTLAAGDSESLHASPLRADPGLRP
jgi:thiamine-phosphate pyrophosphorylase